MEPDTLMEWLFYLKALIEKSNDRERTLFVLEEALQKAKELQNFADEVAK